MSKDCYPFHPEFMPGGLKTAQLSSRMGLPCRQYLPLCLNMVRARFFLTVPKMSL